MLKISIATELYDKQMYADENYSYTPLLIKFYVCKLFRIYYVPNFLYSYISVLTAF